MLATKGGPRLTAGSSWPDSVVLEISRRTYIIDAGLGVTRQFVEAGYSLDDIHTIVITHHHSTPFDSHNLDIIQLPRNPALWTAGTQPSA